jgi:hypothetical protein
LRANDEQQLHHHNIQKLGKSSLPTQQLLLTTPDKVASHHMPTVLDSDKNLIYSHSLSFSLSLCLSDSDYNTLPPHYEKTLFPTTTTAKDKKSAINLLLSL